MLGRGSGSSGSGSSGSSGSTQSTDSNSSVGGSGQASVGDLSVKVTYNDNSSSANAIAGTIEITNNGSSTVDLSNMQINYYFTFEGGTMVFDCYHAATNSASGQYTALTNDVNGSFSACSGEDRDMCLTITIDSGSIAKGDTLTISFSCHRDDWQNMDLSNDWSHKSADNIEVIV